MVAAIVRARETSLAVNGAPEFPSEYHQRVVQHASLLQVLNQRPARLVDLLALAGQHFGQIAMDIPATVINLDEAYAAFCQPSGHQCAVCETAGLFGVRAVHLPDVVGFLAEVSEFRHRTLHTEGHFVLSDAGFGFRVAQLLIVQLVHLPQGVQHAATHLRRDAFRVVDEQDGVSCAAQSHA